jgi:hypothetical protein
MRTKRDPRQEPEAGDQVLIRSEGTPRVVVEIEGDGISRKVTWRWLGGTVRRTSAIRDWRQETKVAQRVNG